MNAEPSAYSPNSITILAFNGTMEMSIGMARDVWHTGLEAHQIDSDESAELSNHVVVATQDGESVRTFNGSILQPDCAITDIQHTDEIVVCGSAGDIDAFINNYQPTANWIAQQYHQGAKVVCLHTGTFLLAETGLLDNRVATVYWRMVDEFKSRYPQVILQPEKNITSVDNIYCSSGIASAIEMGIYFIEKAWGVSVAGRVSRHFMMDIPKSATEFQLALEKQKQHSDAQVQKAQQWFEANFSSNFLLEEVADKVGMSLQSFRRRFKSATGETPMQYLHRIRLETAKQLLVSSSLGVEQISYRIGYEDASYFSRLFKQKIHMTPLEFRSANQGKLKN